MVVELQEGKKTEVFTFFLLSTRFYFIDSISTLLEYIDSLLTEGSDVELMTYNVVTHYPKRNISIENGSIEQVLGKEKSHTLFVERS